MVTKARLTRRNFLKLTGLTALAAASGCRPSRQLRLTPTLFGKPDVEIALTAQTVQWELAPGKVITAWTYNGSVPGETIRVREGDRVRVIVKNDLPEPTTIHWHSVDVPTTMDGVPDISQPAIPPGETFTYEFEARPAGTRWYHTHFNSAKQLDLGLSAPFIIEPLTPESPVDREYSLAFDDWVTGAATPNASPTEDGATPALAPGASVGGGMMGGGMMGSDSSGGMMGGMMGNTGPAYDTFTLNGKAFPATEPVKVRQGERVRLRLINASNMQTFAIRLAGHRLRVTHTDGNPLQTPVEVDAVPVAPAERYDVTFVADNPGKWPLYALDPAHTEGGLKTLVVYEGFESDSEAELKYSSAGLNIWSYDRGAGIDTLPLPQGQGRAYDLTLSGGMMMASPNEWTINSKAYPDTDILQADLNQLVQVRLFNMSMQAHPFHLHGQSFRVLSLGGQALSAPLIKDTVDIPAMMGAAEIEFVAFNPGYWMFHCHKPMHMDGGMAMLVKIG